MSTQKQLSPCFPLYYHPPTQIKGTNTTARQRIPLLSDAENDWIFRDRSELVCSSIFAWWIELIEASLHLSQQLIQFRRDEARKSLPADVPAQLFEQKFSVNRTKSFAGRMCGVMRKQWGCRAGRAIDRHSRKTGSQRRVENGLLSITSCKTQLLITSITTTCIRSRDLKIFANTIPVCNRVLA